ncbi:DUF4376 domain-containing protein [Acinetobacter haemolyticus]|uniref:DUF4376 domain-containing protein n=1 Tax=Acinetobacter haemolyticus TaxID=29430 RepID=UPI0013727F6E|nr:DUF4376 domain-containing protein [Acinetobacter haemolyticus]NAR91525.1 DUF4376 domain-containing protein [Acinetobacter haemolyticus]
MTTFVDADGKLLLTIHANAEIVALNAPEGGIAVIDPPSSQGYYYYCHADCEWRSIPDQPSRWHSFDCASRTWVDNKTLEDAKVDKWAEIKDARDQLEFGGFEFDGGTYDSDQLSQGRIMGAAAAGVDQTWTLADNTTAELSASQLQQLYAALQAHIASAHERGRIARQLIFDAETKEQVEAVQL